MDYGWLQRIPLAPSTITWNQSPFTTLIGSVNVAKDQWASFDVTSTVKSWVDGTKANNGFALHTNGNGQTYWKKIISSVNSTNKPYMSVDYTIPSPSAPVSNAYSKGDGSGYVNVSWQPVKGATGYKVWMYNGISYESFSVGNVTSWSTQNQKIWPTASEISSGRYTLHHDSGGTDLAVYPSPVYKNSGGSYSTARGYWFRVNALFPQGESAVSSETIPIIPDLSKPKVPVVKSYTYGNSPQTGFADINWEPVQGATGYKVWIYNGANYESKDLGNVTSWSTKGLGIWPSANEGYNLHLTDGKKGMELPIDPSAVYKKAGPKYANDTVYWLCISAYNSQGETVLSNYNEFSIPDLVQPPAPMGTSYSNQEGSKSGYVMLRWNKIDNATGYKVWLYDGVKYVPSDAGDTDHWTTQGKGIWPSAQEIQQGKLASGETLSVHTDGKGSELPLDPSSLYAKTGKYGTYKVYWFRISAYNAKGETVYSPSDFTTFIPEADKYFGTEDYWSILDVPYGSVNAANGNLIISENDVSISGKAPGFGISRTYNSLSPTTGLFGKGWHSSAEMNIVEVGNEAIYTDEDGTIHRFQKNADLSYQAPTGVYLGLIKLGSNLILTDKSQTKYTFRTSDGKLTSITDSHNNQTDFHYTDAGQLDYIADKTRKISIYYNDNGQIERMVDPKKRTFTFEYEAELLTKVSNPAGEMTQYEYDSQKLYDENKKLIKIYEPTSTPEVPVVNQFTYSDGKLKTAISPENKTYSLDYLVDKKVIYSLPNKRKNEYQFNEAGNPSSIVEDKGGLELTTKYIYEGNNLEKSWNPKDIGKEQPSESNTYDKNGNLLTSTTIQGTVTNGYNGNNDVTSSTDTEGKTTTTTYDGVDPVSETDTSGKVSSVAKYDTFGNVIESSSSLAAATNLLVNPGFDVDVSSWFLRNSFDSGSISSVSNAPISFNGKKSLQISAQSITTDNSLGYVYAKQEIPVKGNTTYTISGMIKTNLSKANAFFNIEFFHDSTSTKMADNRYSQLTGNQPWTNRQFTFTTPKDANKIAVYLEVEHKDNKASGNAWFDNLQLEEGDVTSSYNPINNGSFENAFTSWTGKGGSIDTDSFDGKNSIKLARTSTTQAANVYSQTITIGQNSTDQPSTLTLTGMSKADGVTGTSASTDYALKATVTYSDNTTKEFWADFPAGTQEWNRAAVKIPATKPISKIDVSLVFQGNYTGTVWFDAIRLLEGNVLSHSTYDEAGNYLTQTENLLGNVTSKSYDEIGNVKDETDAKGAKKVFAYDLMNRLQNVQFANKTQIDYLYDKNGNMNTKTTTANDGKIAVFTYDYYLDSKLWHSKDPLGYVTTHSYDENGNLQKIELPKGNFVENTYDGANRVKTISNNGELTYEFGYDKNGNEEDVFYKQKGEAKKHRDFDSANRMTDLADREGTQHWNFPTDSDKVTSFIYKQGIFSQTNTYGYNQLNQNTTVSDGTHTAHFDYDERGQMRTYIAGNGAGATYNLNDGGQIVNLTVGTSDGVELLNETSSYDKNGNRTNITNSDGTTVSYEYGELDQLTKETLRDGTVKEYHYDGFGNRDQVKVTKNGQMSSIDAHFNAANQMDAFGNETITYDKNGNRTTDGQFTYGWNNAEQLETVTKGGESTPFAKYQYDEQGRRIQKEVNGVITKFYYDGDSINLLYETDAQNNVLRSYTYSADGQLLSMRKGNATYYYHFNTLGDVIAITDQNGNKVAGYEYDAWGNTIKSDESDQVKDNPFRYAQYQFDKETGLYYLIARYYLPTQGVFLSLDPFPGNDDVLLTQNGYAYGDNNPVMNVDPSGYLSVRAAGLIIDGFLLVTSLTSAIIGIKAFMKLSRYLAKDAVKNTKKKLILLISQYLGTTLKAVLGFSVGSSYLIATYAVDLFFDMSFGKAIATAVYYMIPASRKILTLK